MDLNRRLDGRGSNRSWAGWVRDESLTGAADTVFQDWEGPYRRFGKQFSQLCLI